MKRNNYKERSANVRRGFVAFLLGGENVNKIEQWMNSRIGLNFRSGLDRMEQAVSLLGEAG